MAGPFQQPFFPSGWSPFTGTPIGLRPDVDLGAMLGTPSPEASMLSLMVGPLVGKYVGNRYVPGQFQPTSNLYDQFRAKALFQMQQQSMRAASEIDQGTYFRMIQGVSNLAGTPFGFREQRAAQELSSDIARFTPMIAPFAPELMDRLHGSRGSAVIMAQQLASTGRYATDPVTGARGMTAESVRETTGRLFERLYGPDADVRQMRGITAGTAGKMFDEMTRRGLVGDPLSRDSGLSKISTELGKTIDEVSRMPDLDNKLRQFEADRTVAKIRGMAKSVSAMKDIFGEMGRPDAPMAELIDAVEALTQGGLRSMTDDRLESTIRTAANVARGAGTDIRGLAQVTASVTGRADSFGLDRSAAFRAGVGGIAFADAFGRAAGGLRIPGIWSKEQAALQGAALEVNAAASPVANQLATVLRLGEEFKAFDTGGNTDAARLFQAINSGQTTWTDAGGRRQSVYLPTGQGPGTLNDILSRGGVDPSLASRVRAQPGVNFQNYGERVTGLARQLQGTVDVMPRLAAELAGTFRGISAPAGVDPEAFKRALDAAAGDAARNMINISAEDKGALFQGKVSPIVDPMIARLKAAGINVDDGLKGQLTQYARLGVGNIDEMVTRDPNTRGYGRGINYLLAADPAILRERMATERDAQLEGRFQTAFSTLARGGVLERLSDALQGAGPATDFKDLVAQTFGYVEKTDIAKVLEGPVGQVRREMEDFQNFNPGAVRARVAELTKMRGDGMSGKLAERELGDIARKHGMTPEQIMSSSDQDFRYQAKSSLYNRIRANVPMIEAEFDRAGFAKPGNVSAADINRTYQAAQAGRGSAADEATALAERFIGDERSMALLDQKGLGTLQGLMGDAAQLKDLAAKHTGGDVAALLAGKGVAQDVKTQAAQLRQRIMDTETSLGQAAKEGKSQESTWSPEYKKQVEQYRKDLTAPTGKALSEMLSVLGAGDLTQEDQAKLLGAVGSSDALQRILPEVRKYREMIEVDPGRESQETEDQYRALGGGTKSGGVAGLLDRKGTGQALRGDDLLERLKDLPGGLGDTKKDEPKPVQAVFAKDTKLTGTLDLNTGAIELYPTGVTGGP